MALPITSQQQQQPQSQHFLLKWNNHRSNLVTVFENLLQGENLVDVTLAVEGKFLKAHKIVLSACSPYFQSMFVHQTPGEKHPILIFHDLKFAHLKTLLEFMYRGEISIDEKDLSEILKVAEALSIRGLSSFESDDEDSNSEPNGAKSSNTSSSANVSTNGQNQGDASPGNGTNANSTPATPTNQNQTQSQASTSSDNQNFYRQQNVCDSNGRQSPAVAAATGSGRGKTKTKPQVKVSIDEATGLPIKRKRGRQPKAAASVAVDLKPAVLKRERESEVKTPAKQGVRRRMPRKYASPSAQPQVKREKLSTDDVVDDLDTDFLNDDTALEILNSEPLSEMSVRGLDLFKYASIEDGVYRCMECEKLRIPKTFKNKYSFQRHAFLYHEGNMRKFFPCPVCSREFSRPDKMKNHLKSVHQGGGNGKPSSPMSEESNSNQLGSNSRHGDNCDY